MEYENRMEQHYAVSKGGVLLHIKEAHDNNEECFCPHCGCRMLKRCGKIRTWHFAHDYRYENEVEKNCSYESYLHAFAKLRIKQWFEEADAINLHYHQRRVCEWAESCKWRQPNDNCIGLEEKLIDLKRVLTECRIEETIHTDHDRFRADLYWYNPNKPENGIMVEVKVTHECTAKKKESKARIIEFEVHSEEDVERIVNNDIRESEIVHFYGFSPTYSVDCSMPAKHMLTKFIYYQSGKVFPRLHCNCQDYMTRKKTSLLELTIPENINEDISISPEEAEQLSSFFYSHLYHWGISLANEDCSEVKNCCLCKHQKYDSNTCAFYCELSSTVITQTQDALKCGNYEINKEVCSKNINEWQQYSKYNTVDIWKQSKYRK